MEMHPLVADLVTEVEAVLAETPALTAPELKMVLGPLLDEFLVLARGPGWVKTSNRLEDRPPLEREFLAHPSWKRLCTRYGDALVAMSGGGWA